MLVQSAILEFIRNADPYSKDGVEIVAANVHSVDGDAFTAQRRLDLYNLARKALLSALHLILPKSDFLQRASGAKVVKTDLTFAVTSEVATANKPSDYIMLVDDEAGITKADGTPLRLRTNPAQLKAGNNPELFQDAATIFVFEEATYFVHYGAFVAGANTYVLRYIGHTDWTLANLTSPSTVVEVFKETDIPHLIDIAVKAANGASQAELVNYAVGLLTKKNGNAN